MAARHRSIHLKSFLSAVSPTTLLRFLEQQGISDAGETWLHMNPARLLQVGFSPEHEERFDPVFDQAEAVAELCREGPGIVVRAYRRFGLAFDPGSSPQELALLLFLDVRDAYEFARSRYLLYGGATMLSVYRLDAEDVRTHQESIEAFRNLTTAHFSGQNKGMFSQVSSFEDGNEFTLLIQRGHYVETRAIWEGPDLRIQTSRPAVEDVLTWDRETRELRIRTGAVGDRDFYLRLFAECVCGNERLADRAMRESMFSLTPIQNGTFNYEGSGSVLRVDLKEVTLSLPGASRGLLTLRAHDVREALRFDVRGISLASGMLLSARLKFHIRRLSSRRAQELTFKITPPDQTDIGDRKNALLVLNYLEQQGVKLR